MTPKVDKKTKLLKPELCEVNENNFAHHRIISSKPCFQPKGGFTYVYEWKEGTERKKGKKNNSLALFMREFDGYLTGNRGLASQRLPMARGSSKYLMPGAGQLIGVKKYFQSIIGKDDDG